MGEGATYQITDRHLALFLSFLHRLAQFDPALACGLLLRPQGLPVSLRRADRTVWRSESGELARF